MRALLIVLGLVMPAVAVADQVDIEQLVHDADMAYRGTTSAAVMTMDVKTTTYERSYKIVAWTDSSTKDRDRTLVKILGPALWRGYGTLKVGPSLKLYNPKSNHVTVVSGSMLGESWMGSHFTNDDLVKETRLSEDFELELAKQWKEAGVDHYLVEMTPRPKAPVAWGRISYEITAEGDRVLPVSARYYRKARDKEPQRTVTFGDVKKLGGRMLPSVMTVTVADKPGEYTRLTYERLELGVKLPDSKFTERALRK